uniref:CARD domain-containing protein n=1 Tax=Plectus sambesii TaxID=2011161 RepID=A0A914VVJ8_9BILA
MDRQKQKAIEHHYADLTKSMDPLLVMDNLRSSLLSSAEEELIKKLHSTHRERNRELLSLLFIKREEFEPFKRFVEALKEIDDNHALMAKAILKTYENNNGGVLVKVPKTSLPDAENSCPGLQM